LPNGTQRFAALRCGGFIVRAARYKSPIENMWLKLRTKAE